MRSETSVAEQPSATDGKDAFNYHFSIVSLSNIIVLYNCMYKRNLCFAEWTNWTRENETVSYFWFTENVPYDNSKIF